jgi:integrase
VQAPVMQMVARRAAPGRRRRCRTPGAKRGRARRRAAAPLEHFKPGLGDVAIVLAFTGLRWEEAVAVPVDNVDLDGQCMTIDRTASESGGRRDVRNDMKTRAAVRVVMIPDIAMPAVRRLLERGEAGREQSGGTRYSRLINGERGGYIGYAMWRRYLALAHGYTASHQDGMVKYTAHELRHVCASLLIASGASDVQVANQMGHRKIETTKNIYGHLFAQDRKLILKAINQAVSRLYVEEGTAGEEAA